MHIGVAHGRAAKWSVGLLAGVLGVVAGCQTAGPRTRVAPTRVDALMRLYPDLGTGRFAIVADFEDPRHMSLFSSAPAGGAPGAASGATCTLTTAVTADGGTTHCLRFEPREPEDSLVIARARGGEWALPRDWRSYDLLMLRLKSEVPDARVVLTMRAGRGDDAQYATTVVPLHAGWNTTRIDLAEVAEHIPLDDIRSITLQSTGTAVPAGFWLDDLLLVSQRLDLFGDPANQGGELYLQQLGRRWRLGSGGRFELTFGNGQVVAWHHLADDPHRLRNLLEATSLGPTPVILEPPDETGQSRVVARVPVDRPLHGRQEIVELSAVRAVVACTWYAVDADAVGPSDADLTELVQWVYTIYPTGQVYIDMHGAPLLGARGTEALAVSMAAVPELRLQPFSLGALDAPGADAGADAALDMPAPSLPFVYASLPERGGAWLLVAVHDPVRWSRTTAQVNAEVGVATLVAVGSADPAEPWSARCQLVLGNADAPGLAGLRRLVRAYLDPPVLHLHVGRIATVAEAGEELSSTGYSPARGCYVLMPQGGRLQFAVPAAAPGSGAYGPVFRVLPDGDGQGWVYVDQETWPAALTDGDGALVFQVPARPDGETLVEVLFEQPEAGANAADGVIGP